MPAKRKPPQPLKLWKPIAPLLFRKNRRLPKPATWSRNEPQQVMDARARLDSAASHLEQARADLLTAQLNLSYTKIYAPVSGVIGRKTVEIGHRVQPGQSLL